MVDLKLFVVLDDELIGRDNCQQECMAQIMAILCTKLRGLDSVIRQISPFYYFIHHNQDVKMELTAQKSVHKKPTILQLSFSYNQLAMH